MHLPEDVDAFVRQWTDDWNAHDLDRILSHYTDDVVFASPRIAELTGAEGGEVRGIAALRAYWASGLQRLPNLRFTVEDCRVGVDSLVINYRNENGRTVAEVLMFRDGVVCRGFAAYGPA